MNADLLQGFYLRDLLIEPTKGRVTGPDGSEHVPSKAIEVLLCLAARPAEAVPREELLESVWGAGKGSDEALTHAVSELRHALRDHPEDPRYIQTLPRRGYRLLVTPLAANGDTGTIVLGTRDGASADELGLFENLNRRGVLETALAYLVLGWLLIQVADIVFGQLLLPQWFGTFVTVLVIAGFPIALALSWFLEIRDGKAVVDHVSPRDARRRRFSRTYMSVLSALMIAAIGVLIYDQSIGLPEANSPETAASEDIFASLPVMENSIAVLPFLNVDGSPATQVFSNGLVDGVINRLARVPGLMVSARGDSSTLEPNTASGMVRERLRVALYLEGSVEMSGDEIRVIVQLIDSETGFHVFSRNFDRPRNDIFDIRDEITELMVANIRVALPPDELIASMDSVGDPSLDTYLLYRQGIDALQLPATRDTIADALNWFAQALEQDPDYAAAYAGRCSALIRSYAMTDDSAQVAAAEAACGRALQLNPNLDVVHTALGNLFQRTGRYSDSESAFHAALEINDKNVEALNGLGRTYLVQGELEAAESTIRKAIGLRPGDWESYNNLGALFFRSGRYAEAAEQFRYVISIDRNNYVTYTNLGSASMLNGDFDKAISVFRAALELGRHATTYSSLGLAYYYTQRLDEAIEAHRMAIELSPDDHLAWSNLGDTFWAAGQEDESRDAFENARDRAASGLEINADDAFLLMDMAWILTMLDRPAEAREAIDRAHELSDDPYVSYIDGLMRLREGDIEMAIAALEDAVENGHSTTMMAVEPHLATLRDNEDFRDLIGISQ
ncbi:MAG: tetratricopeptide repeat protein [Woeseiaceae bacterium]|nr:tetratricopeptide repeat protein [Woeseiaceae bacterium]